MQKITSFLWFDGKAEEAMNFYISIFKNSKVVSVTRYGEAGPGAKGTVMTAAFQLEGQEFVALNGGPQFTFSPAISFVVNCESQQEIDEMWEKLSAGGAKQSCGWLQDKFGVSWQIVPANIGKFFSHPDPAKSKNVMQRTHANGETRHQKARASLCTVMTLYRLMTPNKIGAGAFPAFFPRKGLALCRFCWIPIIEAGNRFYRPRAA